MLGCLCGEIIRRSDDIMGEIWRNFTVIAIHGTFVIDKPLISEPCVAAILLKYGVPS